MQAGYDGLLRDKMRPSRIPPRRKPSALARVPFNASGRAHGLQPHRVQQFKLSNDPKDKLRDVVGLHVAPPVHASACSRSASGQLMRIDESERRAQTIACRDRTDFVE